MAAPTLETPRFRLRAYTPSDRLQFVDTHTDDEVMAHVGGALSPEAAGALFDSISDGSRPRIFCAWCAVERKQQHSSSGSSDEADDVVVGHAALLRTGEGEDGGTDHQLEIGYIISRRFWGRGYATEVADAVTQHALGALRKPRLTANVDADHAASIRVLLKIGMAPVERVLDDPGDLTYEAVAGKWESRMQAPVAVVGMAAADASSSTEKWGGVSDAAH
jgi:ribosomal-protein-alanine N-acetyltransferase